MDAASCYLPCIPVCSNYSYLDRSTGIYSRLLLDGMAVSDDYSFSDDLDPSMDGWTDMHDVDRHMHVNITRYSDACNSFHVNMVPSVIDPWIQVARVF